MVNDIKNKLDESIYTHENIVEKLRDENSDEFTKVFSIVNLDCVQSSIEQDLLLYHLTNHKTPIREVVALKLEDLFNEEFITDYSIEQILKAIIDINPNVCRAICELIAKTTKLKTIIENRLIQLIDELIYDINLNDEKLGGFYFDSNQIRKNHAKNKKLFSLYWYLEVLSVCFLTENQDKILKILNQTIKFNDYTIREKTAKIMTKLDNIPFELLQNAKQDQNFYVKNQVYDKIDNED